MKARPEDRKKAEELRRQGFSYKEIQRHIKVSKSLLSGWFKMMTLTTEEEEFLRKRTLDLQNKGRIGSMLSNRNRRIAREIKAFEQAKQKFAELKGDSFFLLGISLYWAEGAKRSNAFQFINSDPDMIKVMLLWIQRYLGIKNTEIKYRLYIHKIPGYETSHDFWANLLGVDPKIFQKTVYKPTIHAIKKNPDYKGCLRMQIGGMHELRLMKAWQKLLVQYIVK